MTTAITPANERSTATQSLTRNGHPHGRNAQGKASANLLFAEALTAANPPETASTALPPVQTDRVSSEFAKKDKPAEPNLQEATVAAFLWASPTDRLVVPTEAPSASIPQAATTGTATSLLTNLTNPAASSAPTGITDGTPLPDATTATGPVVPNTVPAPPSAGTSRIDTDMTPATVGKAVSTMAKTAHRTLPPPQALMQAMGLDPAAATQAWHMSNPGDPGNRLQNSSETVPIETTSPLDSTSAAGEALATGPQNDQLSDHAPGDGQGNAASLLGEPETRSSTDGSTEQHADAPFAQSLGEAMGEAFQNLGTQVSYWAGQNVRRASINLDIGTDQPLQVEVTLDGDKAQLDFRTNDASARAALQLNAEQVLNDLLARNGLGLAGLSVGAQAQQFTQHNPHSANASRRATGISKGAHLDTETPTVQRWVQRSTSTVDFYA